MQETNDSPAVGTRKAIAADFLRLAASTDVRLAFERFVSVSFRHHNPYFAGDAVSLADAMAANASENPHKRLDIMHIVEDGDVVMAHSRVRQSPDSGAFALVHIFRFEGDRIAELWDIAQAVPDESPNEHGMF